MRRSVLLAGLAYLALVSSPASVLGATDVAAGAYCGNADVCAAGLRCYDNSCRTQEDDIPNSLGNLCTATDCCHPDSNLVCHEAIGGRCGPKVPNFIPLIACTAGPSTAPLDGSDIDVPAVPVDGSDAPAVPSAPGAPSPPSTPAPAVPGTPAPPATPNAPGVPSTPSPPSPPSPPSVPATPSPPATPGVPAIPSAPGAPAAPGVPATPSAPGTPSASGIPAVPAVPGVPNSVPDVNVPGVGATDSNGDGTVTVTPTPAPATPADGTTTTTPPPQQPPQGATDVTIDNSEVPPAESAASMHGISFVALLATAAAMMLC